jgi:membrane protease YdiL (CAAX protease family)
MNRSYILLCTILALIVSAAVGTYLVIGLEQPLTPVITAAITVFVILMPYLVLLLPGGSFAGAALIRTKPLIKSTLPLWYMLPYLFFSVGTASFEWSGCMALLVFLLVPWGLLLIAERYQGASRLCEVLAIFAIWLPFDTGWIKHIWNFPKDQVGAYPLNAALAVSYAIILFVCMRRIKNVGFVIQLDRSSAWLSVKLFLIFFAIALAIGIPTDFISYNGRILPDRTLAAFLGILLFIAIPEELLFRGLFLNLLEQKLKDPAWALAISSLIFGLTHLNNAPVGDWRYVLLATIAGVVYGYAYLKTKNLTAPALIHAMVDSVWIGYFK